MNKIFVLLLGLGLSFPVVGCNHGSDAAGTGAEKSTSAPPTTRPTATTYTCSMHPEVVSDKPGKCPKCGMDLTAKK